MSSSSTIPYYPIIIIGGGIVGMVLSIGLKKKLNLAEDVHIFEKVDSYAADVGAGMGMYPNGLRVLYELGGKNNELLQDVVTNGYLYEIRKYERHDGTTVATSDESVLSNSSDLLRPLGIKRFALQQVLYRHCTKNGVTINFGKSLVDIKENNNNNNNMVICTFSDGTQIRSSCVLACDGSKSIVREKVCCIETNPPKLKYTGITCLMGMCNINTSNNNNLERGIMFPSSLTTKCHGCFFPTSATQFCFQMHMPVEENKSDVGSWGTLHQQLGEMECHKLQEQMKNDGWATKYYQPLSNVSNAVKIGFCLLEPPLHTYTFGGIFLVGDAAHPPVPYSGQGAQMGLEDAGTLILLLEKYCMNNNGELQLHNNNLSTVAKLYNQIRIPRVGQISQLSQDWGKQQQKRAEREQYNVVKEELIQRNVFYHETHPHLIPGATYDFKKEVEKIMEEEGLAVHMPVVKEEEQESEE